MPDEQMAFDWADDASPGAVHGAPGSSPPRLAPLPRIAPLAIRLKKLAARGIYLGTSSWKYPGWLGQVYDPARYQQRGKFVEKRFGRDCLAEYAKVFPTVGGDFSFYQFPTTAAWRQMFGQVPEGFRFSMKIPEELTVQRWPDLPRYGRRAGAENTHFMDAGLLSDKLLALVQPYRDRLGVLIFEFGTLHERPMCEVGPFSAALDRLFGRLPLDRFKFAVEVRNRDFLSDGSDYLACLKAHGVAHCFNSWTRMPPIHEQMRIADTFSTGHVAARFLLHPGRSYQQAVDRFSPYERVQEPYPEGRAALRDLINHCLANRQALFAFVNNRFEGNAPQTIDECTHGFD